MFFHILRLYAWIAFFVVCVMYLAACPDIPPYEFGSSVRARAGSWDQGGGETDLLHLPLPKGTSALCTQGAGGSYSHQSVSTAHDLDFDTSNTKDEEVYAPVTGIAYIHLVEKTGSGFGNHVNIERADGTYVVVAHLKTVFVCDECEVAAGQLIGYEGCTGACTGDHVHVGLHTGAASDQAEKGVSVPATYLVRSGNETVSLASDAFVCGLGSKGEPHGQHYTSVLSVAMHHPDGTLIKTGNDSKVFLLSNGKRRWIANEKVFWSLKYDFTHVVTVSDEEMACYEEGSSIGQIGLVDAVQDPGGSRWLIVGSSDASDRFRIKVGQTAWEGVMQSWGLPYTSSNQPAMVDWSHEYLTQWSVKPGTAVFRPGSLVKEYSQSAVYVAAVDRAFPIKNWSVYLLLGFYKLPVVLVPDGSMLAVQGQVGACESGVNCVDLAVVTSCGGSSISMAGFQEETGSSFESNPSSANKNSSNANNSSGNDSDTDGSSANSSNTDDSNTNDPGAAESPPRSDKNVTVVSSCPMGELACIVDADQNGLSESLLLADVLWTAKLVVGKPAYVYANGGCFDGSMATKDIVYSKNGYYRLDFSKFGVDCASQLTIVSTIGTDGGEPRSNMTNWLWWQGAAFCSKGSLLCNLMNNSTPWEEWLLAVSWHPVQGLIPNGNGFTSNSQL